MSIRSPFIRSAAVAVGALLLATACEYQQVDGVGTRTMDDEFPPQLDVALGSCSLDEWNRWHADLAITNNTAQVQTYEVTVGFYDDDIRLSQRAHWVRALRPGEIAEVDASWWVESPERVDDCRLLTVNRFG
ncbi:MAG: hypothetical protein AAF548_15025 [Actinomycetota bacterium]